MPSLPAGRGRRLGPHGLTMLERIQRSGRAVVRIDRDASLLGDGSRNAVRHALKGLADGGWLRRLERGAYIVTGLGALETHGQLAIVADWLEGERYLVTGFFALAHWDLTGHPPTAVDILLPRRKANVRYSRTLFRFIYVPAARLPDGRAVEVAGARANARVAGPESALIDVLAGRYAVDIDVAREAFERGLRSSVLQRRRLIRELRRAPAVAARRLGWIAEQRGDSLAGQLDVLVGNDGYAPLDPGRSVQDAERNTRWRLLVNGQR